jgi:hypothetical protein
VFLELIATGDHISLYSYTDAIKTRYFVKENQLQPFELIYQEYYDETGTNVLTSKQYQQQLGNLAEKYANGKTAIVNNIVKTDYKLFCWSGFKCK